MQFKNFKLIPSLTATLVALMWLGVLPVVDSVDTAFAQGPVPSGLFSRPIRSVSPDLPFETCIQGHFDLPPGTGTSGSTPFLVCSTSSDRAVDDRSVCSRCKHDGREWEHHGDAV